MSIFLFIGPMGNHGADSSMSDSEGHEATAGYMYKWPWIDQRAYNMSASEGKNSVLIRRCHSPLVFSRCRKSCAKL